MTVDQKVAPTIVQVLIVEDDPDLASNLATAFSLEDISTAHAQTGPQALELAKTAKPKLIILDILLPQFSGLDVLKKLKEQPETKDIPVVMASVLSARDEQEKALSLGADDYLAKDELPPEEIVARVRHYLKT